MQYTQTNKPKKLNVDKHPKYLLPDESRYLLNNEQDEVNFVNTPLNANSPLCEMEEMPSGENNNVGRMNNEIVNEEYSWTYNSNGAHFISRIKNNGECEIVYFGECLKVSANPANEIVKDRAKLHIDRLCHKVPGGILKELIWVDGINDEIFCLDVEASIATENFTTPFFDLCRDDCAFISLCVPQPQQCIHAQFVPRVPSDSVLTNFIADKGLKFMYRYEYYDKRRSEWSDRSSLYYQNSKECFDSDEGLPRCMTFDLPLGNAMVEKIHLAVSEDGGTSYYLYDAIEKYKPYTDDRQYWYERELNEDLIVDIDNCTFKYTFCNDKQRTAIAPTELSREFNPMPRKVQGIIDMPDDALGFYNYEKGVCPINKSEINKFKVEINCEGEKACIDEIVEVKVRAIIYNFYLGNHGNNTASWFIYRKGGTNNSADDPDDPAMFGSPNSGVSTPVYGQSFGGKARNFEAYIEALDIQSEMTQWGSTSKMAVVTKVGVIGGAGVAVIGSPRFNFAFFYEEASLFVKKGTKGFIRLGSHLNDNATGANQNTSTQVKGIFNIKQYTGDNNLPSYKDGTYEVYFDTCNVVGGVLDLSDAFVIEDLWATGSGKTSSAYNGYIYDNDGIPVEGAKIYQSGTLETTTDHNGFYSFYLFDGTSAAIQIDVFVEMDCSAFKLIGSFSSVSGQLQVAYTDYSITDESYRNSIQKVRVDVLDCNSNGVAGIRVAMSGSKYKVTQSDGFAYFNLRNYSTRNRSIVAVLMDRGGCINTDCNGNCNPCMPSSPSFQLPACFNDPTNVITLASPFVINIDVSSSSDRGLKSGGRYPFAIIAEGNCGKISAANETGYLDIPRTQDKGYVSFCKMQYHIESDAVYPDWVTSLKIVRGENINKFLLSWIVDEISRTANGNLVLTVQSLNDYNSLYNFKTNTSYKYADGDRIEFIKNGDGKIYPTTLNYKILSPYNDTVISGVTDSPADFFNQILLKDNNALSDLKKGAIIEISRQQPATDQPTFFGICATIPVTNGIPDSFDGTFETFDTYLVSRQIGKYPNQKFEHFAPNDFYNNIIYDDRGKVYFKNEYENERRWGRNITVNNPNVINYFGDFEKTFSIAAQGDIIGLNIKDEKIGLGISEKDNFIFSVADDLLRVGANNVIVAQSVNNIISNPEAKLRGMYGCSYDDIGSIFFGDGYATWIDVNANDFIIHNYREARRVGYSRTQDSEESSCSTYFRSRIRAKELYNSTEIVDEFKYRFSTGYNAYKKKVYVTLKRLVDSGVYNKKELSDDINNETIIYNPETNEYNGFASFTPEGYSRLSLNIEGGCAFLSYMNAIPYVHPVSATKWNEFYGIPCDWVVGITLNKGADKIKMPLSFELQSETMFYIYKVEGENFISEIPPARIKKTQDGKWNAAFLRNINTKGALYEGEKGTGYYFNLIFIRDNTLNLKYNSIDNDKRTSFSKLDIIILKFSLIEQSGFTGNL